jgi:riboflavin kinase/FMN adenylyltransferase
MEQISSNEKIRSVVAIGNFDGVHKGHALVFSKTTDIAATEKLSSVALTFTPHPRNYFDDAHPVGIITEDSYKEQLIKSLGIEKVFFQRFDAFFASMDAEKFVSFLQNTLSCKEIVCGKDFRFGNKAAYGIDSLRVECEKRGMKLNTVEIDKLYSSSLVRQAIVNGDMKLAENLMGRPFSFSSEVFGGKKIGSKIGFPTINQKLRPDSVIPRFGVYSGLVSIEGKQYKCVVNIGIRPTVNNDINDIDCESFIIDFSGNLYGKVLRVFLKDFIRDEKKFRNIKELTEQIKNDCIFVTEKSI